MLPNGAVGEKLVTFEDNLAEGGKIKWIENFEAGRQLPRKKKRNDTDNAEPVGNQFARALPQTVRRQRIRFVDRNQIDAVLFLLCRSDASGLAARTLFAAGCDCQAARRVRRAFQISDFKFQMPSENSILKSVI